MLGWGRVDNFQMSLLIFGSPFSLLGLAEIHLQWLFVNQLLPLWHFFASASTCGNVLTMLVCFFLQRLWRKPGCYHPQRLTDFFVRSKFINASRVILMQRMCNAACQVCLYYITLTSQWQPHFFYINTDKREGRQGLRCLGGLDLPSANIQMT